MTERKVVRAANGLDQQINSVVQAMQLAEPYLDAESIDLAAAVINKAESRRQLSADHVVVGLFGATGSGKSTLFNALVGQKLATTGVIRPTTTKTVAAIWETEGANELLDWLEVTDRHVIEKSAEGKRRVTKKSLDSGLMLLDLPDMDSTRVEHHEIATRLVGQVDFLVWVLDPQKYADASIHHGYLNSLRSQQGNIVIVLNQIDKVTESDRKNVVHSLREILAQSGLERLPVVCASAVTGEGLDEVQKQIATVAKNKALSTRRLRSDVDQVIHKLNGDLSTEKVRLPGQMHQAELEQTIANAHGAKYIADAVETSYKLRGAQRTGWPLTTWLIRLRNDPLQRMNLGRSRQTSDLSITSRPERSVAESAAIDHGIDKYVAEATSQLPESWHEPIRDDVSANVTSLDSAVDSAIAATPLGVERSSWWWPVIKFVQWVALLAALAGALWLAAYPVAGYFQFDLPEAPRIEGIAVPTLVLVIGVLLGVVLGIGCSFVNRIVAKVKRRKALKNIQRSVSGLVRTAIVDPVDQYLNIYNSYAELISSAAKKAE
ncbi:GTPase [Arthrobacter sp. S41]|uniref:GTPase n=1 Tax=Arthrobacter sp. S41 TaxID=2509721 RepID=UPI00103669D1|nr:GTPase [Arthrobacter sp. S41]TAP27107.1 ATP-binding cassette domain-containing protein [Arthrobacter sp. S41]